ncbi:MAG TPA: SpoIIE family protein phosphatase [Acidobacteriaceae bacterium]|nr:SpoIIE family protein phosphatase [Acidobacteriaceae bacterium]
MTEDPQNPGEHAWEGDYRPVSPETSQRPAQVQIDPLPTEFLVRLADALNTTLDLKTLLERTASLVRAVIDYRIFAILLYNDRASDLRMRFQIGHKPEVERMRIRMGQGIVGEVAQNRQPMLINDVSKATNYINANPDVRSELAVPLITKNRMIGVIDIQSEQPNYFKQEHLHLLTLTASRIAGAIENARLYTRVARQAQTLQVLNEISREITSILDPDALLERVAQLVRRIIDYQMFSVWLVNERDQVLTNRLSIRFTHRSDAKEKEAETQTEPKRTIWDSSPPVVSQTAAPNSALGLAENPAIVGTTIPLERGLVGAAIREKRVIHVADVRKDSRYHMVNPETRSEMTVPLIYKGTAIGVLDIEHSRLHYFTDDHERAMTTLAAQIAIALENAQLYQRVAQQEQRLERDLAMAREVQLRLLPPARPQHKRAELAARFLPARTIGGDLYDFLQYDANRSAIALGDVSGKAAPAALYAALVSGIMRSVANQHLSPSEMLRTLNDALQERKLDSQYVTMLYGVWNDENLTIQIANGGSVQPLFCRGEEIETIRAEGFPLGMFPSATWEEFSISTQPGDSVIFFSDGIVDAQNAAGEMFGNDRLVATVKKHQHKSASRLAESILTDVGRFQGKRDRFDDETVVVLRVTDANAGSGSTR